MGGLLEKNNGTATRALVRLVTKVRLSRDGLSSRAVRESQTQIEKLTMDIRERVAELVSWHRESWKAEVRAMVLPRVSPHPPRAAEERTAKLLAFLALARPATSKPDRVCRRRIGLLDAVRSICSEAEKIGYCEEIRVEYEHAIGKRRLNACSGSFDSS